MKLSDKTLYEIWYIFCEGGGPYYDFPASQEMSRQIQTNCTEDEFMAMLNLLIDAPDTIEYNGSKINVKEKQHPLWYGLSHELLGDVYEQRFSTNKMINDHIAVLVEKSPDNTYLLDFIGWTSNLDFIELLIRICYKKNQGQILNAIGSITQMHYDKYGLANEEAIHKMLAENSNSAFYSEILQGIEADKESVRKGILHQKKS
jgi:hypothetical protein